jgi:hypothetical protein
MEKRELIGIFVRFQGGLVHQAADRKVSQQETIELLPDEVGSFAAQYYLRAAQMSFQFIQRRLDFPAFMIKRRQFPGRRQIMVQNGGDQTIERLRLSYTFQSLLDHAHPNAIGLLAPIPLRRIAVAQIRTVRQFFLTLQPQMFLAAPTAGRRRWPGLAATVRSPESCARPNTAWRVAGALRLL